LLLLFWCEFFPFGFLLGLKRLDILRFIPLKAGVFLQRAVLGKRRVFFIDNLFVMTFAGRGLTQGMDFARLEASNNDILDRMCFFLPL